MTTVDASCHCGAVHLDIESPPETVTDCNCSICRRYGVLWAYYAPGQVRIVAPDGAADIYIWGDRTIEFHRCKTCGCVTHWAPRDPSAGRMGVNARLMDPHVLAAARLRKLDGAVTEEYGDVDVVEPRRASAGGAPAVIEYRDAADALDPGQLAHLFESIGWHHRARDAERLVRKIRGSMYAVSALDAGTLVGLAQAISDGAFHAYVTSVAVLPEYQRKGIGRELVRRLLDGRPHITFVLHADPPVHPFYLRCGFRPAPDMFRRERAG